MIELFVMAAWGGQKFKNSDPHEAVSTQTFRIQPFMRNIRAAILPVTLAVLGVVPFAQARGMQGLPPAGTAMPETTVVAEARDGISLDEAVSRAERQYRARVVRTDVQDEDGRKVYVLKLLSEDGRVFTVRVDAQSGRSR